ncbi:conserved hypothetical protein [Histoplasma capsulatum G186AR]|uniref:Phospholipase/carboxylesterase/thioesterase domain-containing protein n=2 Tax=Ajellomyces capsulatus TaxID=5037 RepID=C0NML3_AJECG|nr:uncharacterized protein HCBG_03990 [Histoplasma capsulatum G186AR]EEH07111.1 conserved hypothetical protein [Histoplasma capsulatum G186AR]KAG5287769.1 hypothetical protein I7I52_11648 [Histoplasma capsulatum]QSS70359.1 hypothetical protein I7I50_11967 [Histoplasma capsulatum G186AR]
MEFPALHIVEPQSTHTHTVILLHGRSSDGVEFAEDLFDSQTSDNKSLAAHFPSCRWVFPTSRDRWSSVFREELTAWFDVYSLSNPCEQQDLQVDGLRESTLYILEIVNREIDLLGGKSERVFLGGISQGMATALWALLCSPGRIKGRIGAFFGMCGWLPFANKIQDLQLSDEAATQTARSMIPKIFLDIIQCEGPQASVVEAETMLSTPLLLLHGTDDAWIDVELGRQAQACLDKLGMKVDWKEYLGAENEGHWIKQPEGLDVLVQFLEATWGGR